MSTIQQIMKDCRATMDKGLDAARREFASVRSGKASPNMLDTVRVEMYGQQMMLNHVASIAAPASGFLTIPTLPVRGRLVRPGSLRRRRLPRPGGPG